MLMFKSTHRLIVDSLVTANVKVEKALREQLEQQQEIVTKQQQEVVSARAKIERMELALMPLSSAAGATYAYGMKREKQPPILPTAPTDWQAMLKQHLGQYEEQENGIQEQRRDRVYESTGDDGAQRASRGEAEAAQERPESGRQ